jgi:hypothetical protein
MVRAMWWWGRVSGFGGTKGRAEQSGAGRGGAGRVYIFAWVCETEGEMKRRGGGRGILGKGEGVGGD